MKNSKDADSIPDTNEVDSYIDLPTDEDIIDLERGAKMAVKEDGALVEETGGKLEPIKYHPNHPGKKTKATFFNPKTGNYVSYIRAIQLKLV